MIKLYGHPRTSAGRCYLMLEEVAQPYEAVAVDMFKAREHKTPDFLRLNPNGKVPVLVDGDVTLWESVAINQYLAERYRPELLGRSPAERARIEQWNMWAMLELQPPLIDILIETMMKPEHQRSQTVIDQARARLPDLLGILDGALEGRSVLVGDDLTVADFNVLTVYTITDSVKFPNAQYANIARWATALGERPSVKQWRALRGSH